MFQIKSNNFFLLNKYYYLLKQKNFPVSLVDKNSQFGLIYFNFTSDALTLEYNNIRQKIILPSSVNNFFQIFFQLVQDSNLSFGELIYNPIKETLSKDIFILKLRNTHNLIIRNALSYNKGGMNKSDLYKEIWPNDVDIQINKLDTHLTNLKNLLLESFNYELIFKSNQGKIIFLID